MSLPEDDAYSEEYMPDAVRDALKERHTRPRRSVRIEVPVISATRCAKGESCRFGTVCRLPSGAVLFIGHAHRLILERPGQMRRRRQLLAAVLTDEGWLTGDAGTHLSLGCAHRDDRVLDAATARGVVLDVAAGRRRAAEPILI